MIPYGRQSVDEDDIQAVVEVLRSPWLTTGPKVGEFEDAVSRLCGAKTGVAVSSGTAALHAAVSALRIGPGDEVIVPPITFAATANCVAYRGARPVFADVEPDTLLLSPSEAARRITDKTRAIIGVDYAGHPCDWDALRDIASSRGLALVADACHSLGATYKGRPAGALADATILSFHPVKHITTGEGGMLLTGDEELAARVRAFRHHGLMADSGSRELNGPWHYDMPEPGYNYRITDFQCALGLSQLKKLPVFLARRRRIAAFYDQAFSDLELVAPLAVRPGVEHAYHLYVVRIDFAAAGMKRKAFFARMTEKGVGLQVHYIPTHLLAFYRQHFGYGPGLCPTAEKAFEGLVSLPLFPGMSDTDAEQVAAALKTTLHGR